MAICRTKQGQPLDLVVVFSDLHINSISGVRPPHFVSRDGEIHDAPQIIIRHIWEPWCKHWKDVGAEKRRLEAAGWKVRVIGVFNGDGPDRNYHDYDFYETITPDRNSIIDLCERALAPALDVIDIWIINRGTPAHDGGTGELTEMLASRIANRAKVWSEPGSLSLSQYWPRLVIQGVDILFGHHPVSRSMRRHTRAAAAQRTAAEYWSGFCSPLISQNRTIITQPVDAPQLMVFSHVHFFADGGISDSVPVRTLYCPAWQLATSYVHRIGMGAIPNDMGCIWIWCTDGEYEYKPWLHSPPMVKGIVLE